MVPPAPVRLEAALEHALRERLAAFALRPLAGARRAAVALTLVDEGPGAQWLDVPAPPPGGGRAALLLTRRAETLRHHAGQWALPGGRLDDGETAEAAALRELHEEVGLDLPAAAVIGRLDDFATRSGFVITPVVVWGGTAASLRPNPAEVASVHRIALDEFLRPDAPLLSDELGGEHPVLRMPLGTSWIAAPTAALIYQFREVGLLGRETRVAHYEQPAFAWK